MPFEHEIEQQRTTLTSICSLKIQSVGPVQVQCAGTRNADLAKLDLGQHRCEVIAICVQTRCVRSLQCCMTARLSTTNSEGEFMQKKDLAGGGHRNLAEQ